MSGSLRRCGGPAAPEWRTAETLISHDGATAGPAQRPRPGVDAALRDVTGSGRPALACDLSAIIREPDRFSFPSGHATASFAVALAYAMVFPLWSGPLLLLLAALVGFSRVRLDVHYPSDVVVGQLLATLTTILVLAMR